MKENSKHIPASTPKVPRRRNIFGPPPILEGESQKAYDELLARLFSALEPTDFIEEIWARDIVDVIWSLCRLRRILAAFLAAEVWEEVNDKASSLVEDDPELMEGTEEQKEEMARLIDPEPELISWEES